MVARNCSNRAQFGFSLVELMIVVAILGVLSAIVYPAYERHVQRANQSAAQAFMTEMASRAEQYRLDLRDYPDDDSDILDELGMSMPDRLQGNYAVGWASTSSPPWFRITFTPQGSQTGMSILTLQSTGERTPAEEW